MTGVPLDVAVQVVNYRTRRHLEACLADVLADLDEAGFELRPSGALADGTKDVVHDEDAGRSSARVLVLDNASGDDLSELARRHPEVAFETAERNLGFGGGHNLLASRHDAGALLLLNPDTRLIEPHTVARLLAALRGGDLAAVGPQLVGAGGAVDPRDHGELHGFRARVAQAAGHSHYRRRDAPGEAAWVSGAACMVSRRWFDTVGGFDPGFFLYKEEEDLFLRIRRRGGSVLYLPSVRVGHDGGATAAREQHLAASVERFAGKHIPSRLQRRLMPPLHRAVAVWGGRLDRLLGR